MLGIPYEGRAAIPRSRPTMRPIPEAVVIEPQIGDDWGDQRVERRSKGFSVGQGGSVGSSNCGGERERSRPTSMRLPM